MKTSWRLGWMLAAAFGLVLLGGCGRKEQSAAGDAAAKPEFKFSYSIFFPPLHQAKTGMDWAAELNSARAAGSRSPCIRAPPLRRPTSAGRGCSTAFPTSA